MEKQLENFTKRCRRSGLRITPQRIAVYEELMQSKVHPSADMVYRKVKKKLPNISLDTVNRTLYTLAEMGAAYVVEGSGQAKRFDADEQKHYHFRCIKCNKIVDFYHKPFDNIQIPEELKKKFTILRKSVYLEGICNSCKAKVEQRKSNSQFQHELAKEPENHSSKP